MKMKHKILKLMRWNMRSSKWEDYSDNCLHKKNWNNQPNFIPQGREKEEKKIKLKVSGRK